MEAERREVLTLSKRRIGNLEDFAKVLAEEVWNGGFTRYRQLY